jgi:hypothetical protein
MQTSRLFSRHLVLVAAALVLLLSSRSLILQTEAATRTVLGVGDPSELFTNMTRSYRFSSDVTSFQLEETSAGAGPSLLREVKIGEKDYLVASSRLANSTEDGWVQVPMAAFALSLIYPVKREALQGEGAAALSIITTNLLGIYVGELTTWMEAAPNGWFYMAVPDPSAPITFYVQHYEDEASEFASTQGLLGRALCNLTDSGEHIPNADVFCAAYRSNGNRLIPTLEQFNPGRVVALPIGTTPLELIGSLANSTAGLALSTVSAGVAHDLLSIQFESVAGFLTEDQLNQAVPGVGAIVAGESLAIDILNSKAGWPFSALQFVSVPRESVVRGCAYLQSVADFLVWSHTNNMAIDLITQAPHYAVLNNGIRSIAATSVSTVTCNGQAVVAPAVSAAGPPTLLINSWASGYESSSGSGSIRLAYETYLFDITNAESATSGLTDVAVTFTYREHNETMPMSTIPVAAEALVAIYNVPQIALSVTAIPLVFSADLAVKILFGDVKYGLLSFSTLSPLCSPMNALSPALTHPPTRQRQQYVERPGDCCAQPRTRARSPQRDDQVGARQGRQPLQLRRTLRRAGQQGAAVVDLQPRSQLQEHHVPCRGRHRARDRGEGQRPHDPDQGHALQPRLGRAFRGARRARRPDSVPPPLGRSQAPVQQLVGARARCHLGHPQRQLLSLESQHHRLHASGAGLTEPRRLAHRALGLLLHARQLFGDEHRAGYPMHQVGGAGRLDLLDADRH